MLDLSLLTTKLLCMKSSMQYETGEMDKPCAAGWPVAQLGEWLRLHPGWCWLAARHLDPPAEYTAPVNSSQGKQSNLCSLQLQLDSCVADGLYSMSPTHAEPIMWAAAKNQEQCLSKAFTGVAYTKLEYYAGQDWMLA